MWSKWVCVTRIASIVTPRAAAAESRRCGDHRPVERAAPSRRAIAAVLGRVLRARGRSDAATLLGRRRLAPGAATGLDHAGGIAAVLGPAPAPGLCHLSSVMRSKSTRA